MSYEKYTWVTGEVITADKLNHMEDGISAAGVVTVFPVIVVEEAAYVEVTESVLFGALEAGTVIFRESYSVETDGFDGTMDYHIVYAAASTNDVPGFVDSIYFDANTSAVKGKEWIYNEGRYNIN